MMILRLGVTLLPALLLAGCMDERGPLGPRPDDDQVLGEVRAVLDCRVEVRAGDLTCASSNPTLPAGASGTILGGQGRYVLLESSNIAYDTDTEVFSVDVTVRNLVTQTLGTADGASVDAEGVSVFFDDVATPIPAGSGPVTLRNADGVATFTRADQPFFRYPQALGPGKTSLAKTWEWQVPAGVESFSFRVFVAAAVAEEASVVPGPRIDPQSISGGLSHTCALTLDGLAYCWGEGPEGQLATGERTVLQTTPIAAVGPELGAPLRFASIATGYWHTCALTAQGKAYCWGHGYNGQLGNSSSMDQSWPVEVLGPAGPGSPPLQFSSITLNRAHTCALTTDGAAYCWGNGESGQLGNGTEHWYHSFPNAVLGPEGGPPLQFSAISTGAYHTCALTTIGEAYCWGDGDRGQLGNGELVRHTTPVPVSGPGGGPPLRFAAIAAGGFHTCALTLEGEAYCWGLNEDDTEEMWKTTPVAISGPEGDPPLRFASITAGGFHTCALTAQGKAYCWGYDEWGRLGNGAAPGQSWQPVAVSDPADVPGARFTAISAGGEHTCAVTIQGKAYCWGRGTGGRLGNGSTTLQNDLPLPVSDPEDGPALVVR